MMRLCVLGALLVGCAAPMMDAPDEKAAGDEGRDVLVIVTVSESDEAEGIGAADIRVSFGNETAYTDNLGQAWFVMDDGQYPLRFGALGLVRGPGPELIEIDADTVLVPASITRAQYECIRHDEGIWDPTTSDGEGQCVPVDSL